METFVAAPLKTLNVGETVRSFVLVWTIECEVGECRFRFRP
jgi:hypothetical protein